MFMTSYISYFPLQIYEKISLLQREERKINQTEAF